MEKLKLANEKRRAEKLATKKEEEQRKTDKKILRFVRFGGIILVIFLIALFPGTKAVICFPFLIN